MGHIITSEVRQQTVAMGKLETQLDLALERFRRETETSVGPEQVTTTGPGFTARNIPKCAAVLPVLWLTGRIDEPSARSLQPVMYPISLQELVASLQRNVKLTAA